MPVRPGRIHLLPEFQHLLARDHRIGIAVADEDARLHLAPFRRRIGIEQAVKADRGEQRCPVARQFERGLPAHAEADCGDGQIACCVQRSQGLERGSQAGAVGLRLFTNAERELPRLVEISGLLSIEIGDHRQIAVIGERACLVDHARRRIHYGREDENRCARRLRRMEDGAGERRVAVAVGKKITHRAGKSGTERYRSPVS